MGRWRQGLQMLIAAVASSTGAIGCATTHDDSLRLSEELGRARADAAWQQAHAQELEARLTRLEQRTNDANGASAEERKLWSRIDHLLEQNEKLRAEQGAPPAPSRTATADVKTPVCAPSTSATDALTGTPEQQLRTLVERMRGQPGSLHGGLTREQESALRVLMRPERVLDPESPWSTASY